MGADGGRKDGEMPRDRWRPLGAAAQVARTLGVTAALLAVALLGSGPVRAQVAVPVGAVSALVGQASVTRLGETGERPLALGAEVFGGDRIRTAAEARLRLRLIDGSVLTLGAATDLELDRFEYAPERAARNVLLEVPRGIIRVLVELLVAHSTFEVQSHTAVASVRGTEWIAEALPEATAIVALAGRVGVRSADPGQAGEAVLLPGEGTTVPAGAPPQAVTTWGEARRSAFIERTALP
jgi:hypothetical protein